MQTNTKKIANDSTARANRLAAKILGIGAAVGVAFATPAFATQKPVPIKPSAESTLQLGTESIETPVQMPKPKPKPQPVPGDEKDVSNMLPPDPCAAGSLEYDCNQNGINDLCDIQDGWADANEDGILDSCQRAAGDLNLDGAVDARDLVMVLNDWSTEGSDANSDGITDAFDLAAVLSNWTK